MASETLLRIDRSDLAGAFILVNVKSSEKPEVDIDLVATEGVSPYVLSVRQKTLNSLEGRKRSVSDAQWAQILQYGLLSKSPQDAGSDDFRKGFEMVAEVEEDNVKLVFRQRVGELTKGFGSITLRLKEDHEIELFDWVGVAVTKSTELEKDITALSAKYESAMDSIRKLTAQLDDLIVAKEKHEDELLAKCVLLLNEKKSKIRNQQRLLASAKVDPARLKQLEDTKAGRSRDARLPGRASKRKADALPQESETEEDGFEKMDVDKAAVHESDSEPEDQATPERSDEETEGEEEEEVPTEVPVSRATRSHGDMDMEQESPPPVRELPFSNKTAGPQARGGTESTEGETEDDEL